MANECPAQRVKANPHKDISLHHWGQEKTQNFQKEVYHTQRSRGVRMASDFWTAGQRGIKAFQRHWKEKTIYNLDFYTQP